MSINALVKTFQDSVGKDNVLIHEADRYTYSYDAAVLDLVMPCLVVRPTTSEALGKTVKCCNENGLPLTIRGSGTNLSGGAIPPTNGVVILTNGLTKILEINAQDLYARVQPGVITAKFAAAVQAKGLFYPPDPGSQAVSTLGGNVAENAGGLRGLKYGVTKDYVIGLNFFDAGGELIKSGGRTVKCVTGINLTQLLIGSEGTLGVYDEIILKLVPPPQATKAMLALYADIAKASETVAAIIAAKVIPATLELMDNVTIRMVEDFSKVGLPVDAQALLLIEVDGHPQQVAEEAMLVEGICRAHEATQICIAQSAEERNKIWEARRIALSALARGSPTTVLEDATVPRSKVPDMLKALNDIARKYTLTIGTFGHAGDGNLHPTILTDRRNKEEWHKVELAVDEIFDVALSLGGTLSGEHGIGTAKSKYLKKELGRATILYSRRLKKALDPKDILNPDKITESSDGGY